MGKKQPVLINTFEKFDNILNNKQDTWHNFFISFGFAKSTQEIKKIKETYFILHSVDNTEEHLSKEDLLKSNIGEAIKTGNFYY